MNNNINKLIKYPCILKSMFINLVSQTVPKYDIEVDNDLNIKTKTHWS